MKKTSRIFLTIFLIMGLVSPLSKSMAGNVDGKKARKVAAYFMAAQFGNKAITADNIELVYEIPNVEKGVSTLYAFNTADKKGFVIIAGSDCLEPVVAYSTDGPLDPSNIPPAMQWWLNGQANMVAYCQNNNLEAADASLESWNILEEHKLPYFGQNSKEITRLLSTKWNQNYPYNSLCPTVTNGSSDNQGRAYVGCVATAMAQIIRYWEFPRVGNGSRSYNLAINGVNTTLSANFGQTYYDYDLMPDKLTSTSSEAEINAVSLLGYHCGISVNMSYDGDGSGTLSEYVYDAMRQYFKYCGDSIQYYSRGMVTFNNPNAANGSPNARDTAWVNMIVRDILKGRPVYYAGVSPYGGRDAGHAFVCDGWNSTTKTLHFNWGWGGSGDTWCNVYTVQLKPSSSPQQGVTYNFMQDNRVIVGITPPQDSIHHGSTESVEGVENPFVSAIYPNPASSQVTVGYMLRDDASSLLQLFDAAGRMVKQFELSPVSTQVTIPVSDLAPGIYFCRINGYTKKFVVR